MSMVELLSYNYEKPNRFFFSLLCVLRLLCGETHF